MHLVTVGSRASEIAKEFYEKGKYSVNLVRLSINLRKNPFFLDIACRRWYHPGHECSRVFNCIRVYVSSIGDGVRMS